MSKNTVDIANALLAEKAALEARVKELEADCNRYSENLQYHITRQGEAEAELARMKWQEPIYQTRSFNGKYGIWQDSTESGYYLTHPDYRRLSYAGPSPAVARQLTGAERSHIVEKVHGMCSRLVGANFANAAEFTIEEIMALGGEIAE